jgi:hypothetical protein
MVSWAFSYQLVCGNRSYTAEPAVIASPAATATATFLIAPIPFVLSNVRNRSQPACREADGVVRDWEAAMPSRGRPHGYRLNILKMQGFTNRIRAMGEPRNITRPGDGHAA